MSIEKILEGTLAFNICNNCLGRQFGQLLSGYTNAERGSILRTTAATAIDAGLMGSNISNPNNFNGFTFRQNKDFEKAKKTQKECQICFGFFQSMEKEAKKLQTKLKKYEFSTFLIGTRPSRKLLDAEEALWEKTGIDYCEPIRAEINRELGKAFEKISKKKADLKNPDVAIILDMEKNDVQLKINPLYVYGAYKKLKRGIPQCMWGTPDKYPTSVEEEVGRKALKITGGTNHKFHGAGREDIDALCLDWRPFVIEIAEPKKRKINLNGLEKEINKSKKIQVSGFKIADMDTVRKIKAQRADKTYRAIIQLNSPIRKSRIKELKKLKGKISQKTPTRVLHRRANKKRERKVKEIQFRYINSRKIEMIVRGTAGTYIKELVSGDNGRTTPSVSEILKIPAEVAQLDVIKFHKSK